MKATKKIVGAACALVAAVALSAGSTFAWFTSAGKVSAEGMKVQATVPTTLLIAANQETTFNATDISSDIVYTGVKKFSSAGANLGKAASGDPESAAKKLSPTTISHSAGVLTFKEGVGTNPGDGTLVGELNTVGTAKVDGTTTPETGYTVTSYAALYTMKLYLQEGEATDTAASGKKVNAAVTLTSKTSVANNQLEFLHVGILTSYGTTPTTAWVQSFDSTNNTATTIPESNSLTYDLEAVVADIPKNTEVNVLVVLYFEGEDVDCYNNNAMNVDDINVSINYTTANA